MIIVIPLILGACSLIDDDLTVCGEDFLIEYEMQLHTELQMELQTELMTETEYPVRRALEKKWSSIFTDKAKDIDLRFFITETDELKHRIKEDNLDSNRTSYTIKLPKENYMHLGVANIAADSRVQLSNGNASETMALRLPDKKELSPLTTGVFTARLPMEVTDSSALFSVCLYMVTAAVALVVDTAKCPSLRGLEGYMSGSACSFNIRDSIFMYDKSYAMLLERIPLEGDVNSQQIVRRSSLNLQESPLACLATVGFPTQDESVWSMTVTATLTENRHTTTTLTVEEPLKAGTIRIIKCMLDEKGQVIPVNTSEVGATVTLDWKDGGEHEVEL